MSLGLGERASGAAARAAVAAVAAASSWVRTTAEVVAVVREAAARRGGEQRDGDDGGDGDVDGDEEPPSTSRTCTTVAAVARAIAAGRDEVELTPEVEGGAENAPNEAYDVYWPVRLNRDVATARKINAVVEAMANSATLVVLRLRECKLNDEDAIPLARVLPSCAFLDTLDLGQNHLRQAAVMQLAESLPRTNLKRLSLDGNGLSTYAVGKLAAVLPDSQLEELNLTACRFTTGADGLVGIRVVADALTKPSTRLKVLHLAENTLAMDAASFAVADALARNTSLRLLVLTSCAVSPNGAQRLAAALRVNSTLRELRFNGNNVTDVGASAIANALSENANSRLAVLRLDGGNLGDQAAVALAALLERRGGCALTHLSLTHNNITPVGVTPLAASIPSTLRALNLSNNPLHEPGAAALAKALKSTHANLEELILAECGLHDDRVNSVTRALRGNARLRVFEVPGNIMSDRGAAHVADMMPTCPSLSRVNVGQNRIRDRGIFRLADAALTSKSLTTLDVRGNGFTMVGAFKLAEIVAKSYKLERVLVASDGAHRGSDLFPALRAAFESGYATRHAASATLALVGRPAALVVGSNDSKSNEGQRHDAANFKRLTSRSFVLDKDGDHAIMSRVWGFLVFLPSPPALLD